jgi:hypothetical protein
MKMNFFSLLLVLSQLSLPAAEPVSGGFTAHEWGTFTSVQGADGIQFEWNPFVQWDLPRFVHDRNRPGGDPSQRRFAAFASKGAFRTRQRMETPVLYFYADRDQTVDVEVRFPQGLITEWYPRAGGFGPYATTNRHEMELSRQSFLRWDQVQIAPRDSHPEWAGFIPRDGSANSYYAARETDAAFLRVPPSPFSGLPREHEAFLFYRGVGSFEAPLRVTLGANEDQVQLRNGGVETLSHLFLLGVHRGRGKFVELDSLKKEEARNLKFNLESDLLPVSDLQARLGAQMEAALVREGLFAKEAAAMVRTWRDSWMGEEGLRVLYVLPRAWTDTTLPLTFQPRPRELVRVMVGRAEIITPTTEWELLKQIVRFSEAGPAERTGVVEAVKALGLGRFAEPTARRLLGRNPSRAFSQNAWNLLNAVFKAGASGETVAGL